MIQEGKVGRPRRPVPSEVVRKLRAQGLSFRQIARKLSFGYGSVRRAYHANDPATSAPETSTEQSSAKVLAAPSCRSLQESFD
jgi:DNA invertase Pin-like site-specific DNA recombinase